MFFKKNICKGFGATVLRVSEDNGGRQVTVLHHVGDDLPTDGYVTWTFTLSSAVDTTEMQEALVRQGSTAVGWLTTTLLPNAMTWTMVQMISFSLFVFL